MRQRQDDIKIYEAALRQFAKFGYRKTTLDDIADELNMTGAGLYLYAANKQALYRDSVAFALGQWQDFVKESLASIEDPKAFFVTLCRSSIEYLSDHPVFRKILERDPEIFPVFPEADPYEDINTESFRMLKDALDHGVETGTFRPVDTMSSSKVLFSMYKTLIYESYIREDSETVIDAYLGFIDVVLNGLLAR